MALVAQDTNQATSHYQTLLDNDQKYLKSWQSYVNDLKSCEHISDAALYDNEGKLLATSNDSFGLNDTEYGDIINGFRNENVLIQKGIWISGLQYNVFMNDCHFGIMGKRGFPSAGCSICKTRKLLIVAVHKPGMRPAVCNEAVMNMGDFFRRKDM